MCTNLAAALHESGDAEAAVRCFVCGLSLGQRVEQGVGPLTIGVFPFLSRTVYCREYYWIQGILSGRLVCVKRPKVRDLSHRLSGAGGAKKTVDHLTDQTYEGVCGVMLA